MCNASPAHRAFFSTGLGKSRRPDCGLKPASSMSWWYFRCSYTREIHSVLRKQIPPVREEAPKYVALLLHRVSARGVIPSFANSHAPKRTSREEDVSGLNALVSFHASNDGKEQFSVPKSENLVFLSQTMPLATPPLSCSALTSR